MEDSKFIRDGRIYYLRSYDIDADGNIAALCFCSDIDMIRIKMPDLKVISINAEFGNNPSNRLVDLCQDALEGDEEAALKCALMFGVMS